MRTSATILIVLALFGTANATWTDITGGANVSTTPDSIWWGTGSQSGLTFTQNAIGEGVFQLGTLTHTNNPIAVGSNVTLTTLRLDLLGELWRCPMTIDETINLRPLSDDRIVWTVPEWSHAGLTVLGFGWSPDSLVDFIWTPECQSQEISLWASYCPPAVPVPGALVLAGIGSILLRLRKHI